MRLVPVILLLLFSAAMNTPAAMAIDTGPIAGKYAPLFELQDLSGNTFRLSDYRGKVVLLNFWSTLCAPCTAELPSLGKLAAVFKDTGFTVLTVSIDASDKTVKAFLETNNIFLTVLRDRDKEVFFDQYAGPILPASYLIDGSGIITEIITGPRAWDSPGSQKSIQVLLKNR